MVDDALEHGHAACAGQQLLHAGQRRAPKRAQHPARELEARQLAEGVQAARVDGDAGLALLAALDDARGLALDMLGLHQQAHGLVAGV